MVEAVYRNWAIIALRRTCITVTTKLGQCRGPKGWGEGNGEYGVWGGGGGGTKSIGWGELRDATGHVEAGDLKKKLDWGWWLQQVMQRPCERV